MTAQLTPWQTVGPFFAIGLPYDAGPRLVAPGTPGEVTVEGQVLDGHDSPVPDALLEIWHADPHGRFPQGQGILAAAGGFRGFGRCPTDAEGRWAFTTVLPGSVPTVDGVAQAPHLAMSVFARGMTRRAVTRVYFEDHAELHALDPLLASVPAERRHTLVAARSGPSTYSMTVRLQGTEETVFLDIAER